MSDKNGPVKTTIYIAGFAKGVIDIEVRYYDFLDSIVNSKDFLYISKFWFLLLVSVKALYHFLLSLNK